MRRALHAGALVAWAVLSVAPIAAAQDDFDAAEDALEDSPSEPAAEPSEPAAEPSEPAGPGLGASEAAGASAPPTPAGPTAPDLDASAPSDPSATIEPPSEPQPDPVPAASDPRVDAAAFGRATSFLGEESETWVLDDGVGTDELPWNTYDREIGYVPAGMVHFGVALRVAALLGGDGHAPEGPLFELLGFLDLRYRASSPWRMRIAVAVSVQDFDEQYLGAGTTESSSPFSVRSRVLFLNFDIGRWMNIRVGGDLGFQWTPIGGGDGRVDIAGGPTAEIAVLLFDGALEVGVAGGMQLTAYNRTSRSYPSNSLAPQAVIGGTVGYVIP